MGTKKNISLHINLNNYHEQFILEIDSHLVSLQVILKAIDSDTYLEFSEMQFGIGGKMAISKLDKTKFRQLELNKTFISIIRSLQNYIDKLIAIIDFCGKEHKVNRSINSTEELDEYLLEMEEISIQLISNDRSLNFPKKLKYFILSDNIQEILISYSLLRNNLEHHKDIASKDTNFKYLVATLYKNEIEVTSLPVNFNAGDEIEYRSKVVERNIPKGTKVEVAETEINEIIFTLGKIVSPILIETTNNKLTGESPTIELKKDVKLDTEES